MANKNKKNTEAIETIEAIEAPLTEQFELDSFELSLDELDVEAVRSVSSKTEKTTNNKKATEAWAIARTLAHSEKTEEGRAIMRRMVQIWKAFKLYKKNVLVIPIADKKLEIHIDHTSELSCKRVLREIVFRELKEGIRYSVPFEQAINLHEEGVKHFGRTPKGGSKKDDEFFVIRTV